MLGLGKTRTVRASATVSSARSRVIYQRYAATLMAAPFLAPAARADSPQHLVDSATLSLEDIVDGNSAQQFLKKARAVVIDVDAQLARLEG